MFQTHQVSTFWDYIIRMFNFSQSMVVHKLLNPVP